jgi:G:T-mismatch repair DNA endonuclease (very short patch repair protein)
VATLRKSGWKTLVIWECEIRAEECLRSRLRRFLK